MNKGTKKKKIHIKRFYKQNRYGLLSSVMLWCKQMSKHCALCLNLFILVTMVRLHWISSVWIHYDLHQNNTVENSVPLTSLHFLLWLKIAAAGANFFRINCLQSYYHTNKFRNSNLPDIFLVTEDVDLHLLFNAFLQNACYSLVSVMVSEKQALKYMKLHI